MRTQHYSVCALLALAFFLVACGSDPPKKDPGPGPGPKADTGDAATSPDMGGGQPDAGTMDVAEDIGTADAGDTSTPGDTSSDGGGAGDAGDAGNDGGMNVPPTDLYYLTSGGGRMSSTNHEIRISIGAPSPRGEASNANYRLRLAPVSP